MEFHPSHGFTITVRDNDLSVAAMADLFSHVGSSKLDQRYESPCTDVSLPCFDGPIEFSESKPVGSD
jgi:hypothetical protein